MDGIRRFRRLSVAGLILADVIVLAIAAVMAYLLRQSVPGMSHAPDLSANILAGAWIIGFGWITALVLFGAYSMRLLPSGTEIFRNVVHASAAAAGVVTAFLYITGLDLSRAFTILFFLIAPPLLILVRMGLRLVLNALRRRGRLRRQVIAVGSLPYVDSITRTLHRESWLGYEVVGAVVPREDPRVTSRIGIPYLGSEDELLEIIREHRPSILLFTAGSSHSAEEFRRLAWELEDLDLDLIVVPALSEISSDRVSMRPVAGLPLVHMDLPRSRDALKRTKRVFDAVSSAVGIVLMSPVLIACSLAIKLHDGGPVIFRCGRSPDAATCPGTRRCAWTSITWTTGPSPRTSSSSSSSSARWWWMPSPVWPRSARRTWTATTMSCSRWRMTRASPARVGSFAATPWMSCLSCSTCCGER